jgi:hypothetical protein
LVRQASRCRSSEAPSLRFLLPDRIKTNGQGCANAGSGLGGLLLANVTRVTIERYGVKWSLIVNGLIAAVVEVPVIILLKSRHKTLKTKSASFQMKWVYHPGYVWILLFGALTCEFDLVYLSISQG